MIRPDGGGQVAVTIQALLSPNDARTMRIEKGREVWVGLKEYYLLRARNRAEC